MILSLIILLGGGVKYFAKHIYIAAEIASLIIDIVAALARARADLSGKELASYLIRRIASCFGGIIGGFAGQVVGGTVGGLAAGPPGAVVGAAVGTIIGGLGGSCVAGYAGHSLANHMLKGHKD